MSPSRVLCVGGCPTPGNVALDSVGKPRIRFSGLTENDADALLEAAAAYEASTSGPAGDWTVPETLANKGCPLNIEESHNPSHDFSGSPLRLARAHQ